MGPSITTGDVVVASPIGKTAVIAIGRVMIFTSPETGVTTVHRTVSELHGGRFVTKGDASAIADPLAVPRKDFLGIARLLIPFVGLPLYWFIHRDLLLLLPWIVVTSVAFYLATRTGWLADPDEDPPRVEVQRRMREQGRGKAGTPPRHRVALLLRVAISAAMFTVLGTVAGVGASAAAHFSRTTVNHGDLWTMYLQHQGTLTATSWTISKPGSGASGVVYSYHFTTASSATLSSVAITVPAMTTGVPVIGTVTGLPGGGTWSLAGTVLTYAFSATVVPPNRAVTLTVSGLTNTVAAGAYSAVVTTNGTTGSGPSLSVDSGQSGSVTITQTQGALGGVAWSASKTTANASGVAYGYTFTTATAATLSSVSLGVPTGTSGTPSLGAVTGLPSGGVLSLVGTVLTYTFTATLVSASTTVSITISGITNTAAVGSYTAQITTNGASASVPIDNGLAGPLSFSSGTMVTPIWTISNGTRSATAVRYGYAFTTAVGATLSTVTMTVPLGTGGTPATPVATGIPTNGIATLSGTVLTYAFTAIYVNPGVPVTLTIGGLTNSSTSGSYSAEITTNGIISGGPVVPIDTGLVGPLTLSAGALVRPSWVISSAATNASGVAYGYTFTTATAATLSSVSLGVPTGTSGTPSLGAVTGLPSGGVLSLVGTVLTYTFTATLVSASTTVSITISGITNTAAVGSYTAQITTNGASASIPIDNGLAGPLSFSSGTMVTPIWTTSSSAIGRTGVTYTYSFTTSTGATLSVLSISVPVGTSGTPHSVSMAGLPGGGTWSLSGSVLSYAFAGNYINPGTAVLLSVNGITNTATAGSYPAELTTNGTNSGGPVIPIDTGITAKITMG